MQRSIRLFLVALLTVAVGTLSVDTVVAQTPGTTTATVIGTVTAIGDLFPGSTIQVTPKEGPAVTLKVTSATIVINTAGVQAAVGDRATVLYSKDTMEARRITILRPLAKTHGEGGVVQSVGSNSFVLATKKGKESGPAINIAVDANTKYNVLAGKEGGTTKGTFADLKAGLSVHVVYVEAKTGNLATHINVIVRPQVVHASGTISAYQAGQSITVQDAKGAVTFTITGSTKIQYKQGATAVTTGEKANVAGSKVRLQANATAKGITVFGTGQKKTLPKAPSKPAPPKAPPGNPPAGGTNKK